MYIRKTTHVIKHAWPEGRYACGPQHVYRSRSKTTKIINLESAKKKTFCPFENQSRFRKSHKVSTFTLENRSRSKLFIQKSWKNLPIEK